MRIPNRLIGRLAAAALLLLRATCRYRVTGDVRPSLRSEGVPYVYALLHAHQIGAVCVSDEARGRAAAMVSRSTDGDLLVPSLRARGVVPVRGSSRRGARSKGGLAALSGLRRMLEERVAVLLAVDGPRGPRNAVHLGVAALATSVEGAVVLPSVVVPSRRWILRGTWDRMQVPKPFCEIRMAFGEPLRPQADEPVEQFCARISQALDALEEAHDPDEARRAREATASEARRGEAAATLP